MITEGKSSGPAFSVFAVDPGETSGWAWACVSRRELTGGVTAALTSARRATVKAGVGQLLPRFLCGQVATRSWDLQGEHAHVSELTAMLETLGDLTHTATAGRLPRVTDVTIEDFILREGTKDRSLLSPVRLKFGLEQDLHTSPYPFMLKSFQPSQAKGVATDERLKRWGLWTVGQQHARDATRHLVLWLKELVNEEGITHG